jgi:carbonic anhydrase
VKKLLRGIAEFRRTRRADYAETFARLALTQKPDALLIACSDSRVAPNLFASAEPGDLLVVRNVGNLVPPASTAGASSGHSVPAAIEFATTALGVGDVIVCGHSECAAFRAIHSGKFPKGAPHLAAWLGHGEHVLRRDLGIAPDHLPPNDHLSQQNVLLQLDHLRTYPAIDAAERAGKLRLHAWWFDIRHAEVLDYDVPSRRFVPLDDARVERLIRERGSP